MVQYNAWAGPSPYTPFFMLNDFQRQWMYGDGIAQALCWTIGPLLVYRQEIGHLDAVLNTIGHIIFCCRILPEPT